MYGCVYRIIWRMKDYVHNMHLLLDGFNILMDLAIMKVKGVWTALDFPNQTLKKLFFQ
jgi:hypothetical protein